MEAYIFLKKYYISLPFKSKSGIASYAEKFYQNILKDKNYEDKQFQTIEEFTYWYKTISNQSVFFIEIGIESDIERRILWEILKDDHIVEITLHDPPFIAFPYYKFRSRFLNNASKLIQCIFGQHFFGLEKVKKIRAIYVLSTKGKLLIEKIYRHENVVAIPHIATCNEEYKPLCHASLLYTGFVGKKKGLEYALELHENLLKQDATLMFIVTGDALDEMSKIFFEQLKQKYRQNVNYLGFVDDFKLSSLLSQGHVLLLPTIDYKYICPSSANVVNAISKGSVVFTTRANANDEIISDGETGFFLTGDVEVDVKNILLV